MAEYIDNAKDFPGQTRFLQFPGRENIKAAYRELPQRAKLIVELRIENISSTVRALEHAGFFGIYLDIRDMNSGIVVATAWKGKEGPCYDTGKTARYTGNAKAVMDDDNHLLFGDKAICEKTARLYTSPPYHKWICVSPGDLELMARLEHNPVPFDCDTLEADAANVAAEICRGGATKEVPAAVLYPGPFKFVVLDDGTILRRGNCVCIPSKNVATAQKEGAVVLKEEPGHEFPPADNFLDLYNRYGPSFLITDALSDNCVQQNNCVEPDNCVERANCVQQQNYGQPVWPEKSIDMKEVNRIPLGLKEKLRTVIERGDPYFILTGTDPEIPEGCCPSNEVGAANRLVEAGVLMKWAPDTPPDVCPSTVYAFNGEIQEGETAPSCSINEDFRSRVQNQLDSADKARANKAKYILVWALTAFLAATVSAVALSSLPRFSNDKRTAIDAPKDLVPEAEDGVAIHLIHGQRTCSYCRELERYTSEVLSVQYSQRMQEGTLAFSRTPKKALRNSNIFKNDRFIPINAFVLVKKTDGNITAKRLLKGPWELHNEGKPFKKQLISKLQLFVEHN